LNGAVALQNVSIQNNPLNSMNLTNCISLVNLTLNGCGIVSTVGNLNTLYGSLPSFSSGSHLLSLGTDAPSGSNTATATTKHWTLTPDPNGTYPYGNGVGFVAGTSCVRSLLISTTTNYIACKTATGSPFITYNPVNSNTTVSVPATTSVTFWSCVSASDSTKKGDITYLSTGAFSNMTSIDVSGLATLQHLQCTSNSALNSIDVSNHPFLWDLNLISNTSLSTLNISNCSSLIFLSCHNTPLVNTKASLESLYSSLPIADPSASAEVDVGGPASSKGSDLTIATAKNWSVQFN
jgi:hypothetical protein